MLLIYKLSDKKEFVIVVKSMFVHSYFVGWLVVLRGPYCDLEAGDNQSLKS